MSMVYTEMKHKLVEAESQNYQIIIQNDDFLSSCASALTAIVNDTGFRMVGYVAFQAKRYFLISKLSRQGQMLEMPISTEFLEIYQKTDDADIPKHRIKKALKREDVDKFMIEISRFADHYM